MVWVIPVTGVSRVAEVVQRHKGPSPKSWITNMRYFVAMLRFVAIFGRLWAKKCFIWSKIVFLWQEVHYYMIYIAYYTE